MKRILSFLLILCISILLIGCGGGGKKSSNKIYYLSTDKLSIVGVNYEFKNEETSDLIDEALLMLSQETNEIDYMRTIPSGVTIKEYKMEDGNLSLYMTGQYTSLDIYTEVLVRAAIVKTLVQIKGVESVSFYIDDAPLTDASGTLVGAMTADTFIDDFGKETDSLLSTTLTLYFASADGMSVVAEKRDVYYSRNVAVEKLIVDQLLMGPETDGLLAALPADTKINSVSVTDGICYVNFDTAFETSISGITENVTIFSVVNSLTELDSVKQVQLLVNGETPHLSNTDVDLSSPVLRNGDIINTNIVDDSYDSKLDKNGDVIEEDEMPVDVEIEENTEDETWEEGE